jgi:hypothetical protein
MTDELSQRASPGGSGTSDLDPGQAGHDQPAEGGREEIDEDLARVDAMSGSSEPGASTDPTPDEGSDGR